MMFHIQMQSENNESILFKTNFLTHCFLLLLVTPTSTNKGTPNGYWSTVLGVSADFSHVAHKGREKNHTRCRQHTPIGLQHELNIEGSKKEVFTFGSSEYKWNLPFSCFLQICSADSAAFQCILFSFPTWPHIKLCSELPAFGFQIYPLSLWCTDMHFVLFNP